jgi:hypothetical protein
MARARFEEDAGKFISLTNFCSIFEYHLAYCVSCHGKTDDHVSSSTGDANDTTGKSGAWLQEPGDKKVEQRCMNLADCGTACATCSMCLLSAKKTTSRSNVFHG